MSTETGSLSEKLRLVKYIVFLVLDDRKLNVHAKDPEGRVANMNAAELNEEEQRLLTTDGFIELCGYLEEAWSAPVVVPEPHGAR